MYEQESRFAMAKLKAFAVGAVAWVLGLIFAPLLVKVALVAVVVAFMVLVAIAHANDLSVARAFFLYTGRFVLRIAKLLSLLLVELPLRGAHRLWVRFDLRLRLELVVLRGLRLVRRNTVARLIPLGYRPPRYVLPVQPYPSDLGDDAAREHDHRPLSA